MTSVETPPVAIVNETAESEVLLICEHAGNAIPAHLNNLGLDKDSLTSHIAWDIGAKGVATRLAELLNASLILQHYSRLVYDCNRPPSAPDAIPEVSENTEIPGNRQISEEDRSWRIAEIYEPFKTAVAGRLDVFKQDKKPLVITIHSFTPVFKGKPRSVDLGLLFNKDDRLANSLMRQEHLLPDTSVRFNQPYGPEDGVMHNISLHAESRGLPNLMIEIRNDHVSSEKGQQQWADQLAEMIQNAIRTPLQGNM